MSISATPARRLTRPIYPKVSPLCSEGYRLARSRLAPGAILGETLAPTRPPSLGFGQLQPLIFEVALLLGAGLGSQGREGTARVSRQTPIIVPGWLSSVRVKRSGRLQAGHGLLAYALSAVLSFALIRGVDLPRFATPPAVAEVAAAVVPEAVPEEDGLAVGAPSLEVITGRIPRGGTVAVALARHGVEPATVFKIARSMHPVFDFRRARPNDFYALVRDDRNQLLSFEYRRGRSDIYRVERHEDGHFVASHQPAPLERRVVQLGGVIETSLFEALLDLGERPELVNRLADIFIWDFDFSSQTRPGDEFRLVYEKYYDREGFVRYGAVLAAQYRAESRDMTAVYFEDDAGYGDYFTPEGNSVRRTFLRAPVSTRESALATPTRVCIPY